MIETNKLHLGDNLDIMKSLLDESIDLIYADPPFNTGRDWVEFDDRWDSLSGYLDFMTTRIKEIHRLLKPTGSFYLHCNTNASHYLKVEVDKIFSIKNFRNEIVWEYRKWANSQNRYVPSHDLIHFYTKSPEWTWYQEYEPRSETTLQRYGNYNLTTEYSKHGIRHVKKLLDDENVKGVCRRDVWFIRKLYGANPEQLHYPTQKPLALLDRIIQASSNPYDLVLDPFCGSGTACVSANQLGRYYIGIDKNPKAIEISTERLQQQNLFTLSTDKDNKDK